MPKPKPKQRQRPDTPVVVDGDDDDHVSETDLDGLSEHENDENRPINPENSFSHVLLAIHTPLSRSRASQETALRDITDQFFHPPSPSPVRVSKLKRTAPHTIEPPRRPKKPKSLAYPANPPNWLHSRPSSSLPPSSPLPPSTTNIDPAHFTDHSVRHPTPARHVYHLGTPSRASDSDPFGFVAVERALKAKRAPPHKPTSRISFVKSPPRSTVLPSAPSHAHAPVFASFSQLDPPVPTNNEDIEGLYADEPVAGPSHGHVPVGSLLLMNSDPPFAFGEMDAMRSQPTFPDPLRTPRKRRHRASSTPGGDTDPDGQGTDVPSSPSPVKLSVGTGPHTHRRLATARSSHTPVLKLTRAQTRAAGTGAGKPPTTPASRTKHVKTSYQHIPTPSSTRPSASSRQSTAPPTPVPPRRSTRQAAVGARAKLKGTTRTSDGEDAGGDGRMKLRSRSAQANKETKTTKQTGRGKHPPSKSKTTLPKTQKATTTTAKPARGRPKGKLSAKDTKGKGKARPLENVLDLSDDTREKYEKERRERLEYFKRLEGYQVQKENVYIV